MSIINDLVAQVRARGERLTIQRRLVIDVLCEQRDHLAVHDIQQTLAEQGYTISETTVYRILQWLKELGLVSQTDLGQNGIVYQVISEHPHHHLVCLNCGRIMDIDDHILSPLREALKQEYDFEPRIDHMAFFGVCGACRQQEEE